MKNTNKQNKVGWSKINKHFYIKEFLIFTIAMIFFSYPISAQSKPRYEITVTNITANVVLTPILAVSHQENVKLFTLGDEASTELEILAEGGNTSPLANLLQSTKGVGEIATTNSPLPPGQSVTLTVGIRGQFKYISLASMLVPTNDAFFAVNGVEAPNGSSSVTVYANAYDAGTEVNDEDCDNIPGPPMVCMGEGFNPSRAGAEGFVHIHRGIHGIGDLAEETYDWRNPVAKVTIRRIP